MTGFRYLPLMMMLISLQCFAQQDSLTMMPFRTFQSIYDSSFIFDLINSEKINPDDFDGFFSRGIRNFNNGFYQHAVDDFHQIPPKAFDHSGEETAHAQVFYYLGLSKFYLKENDSAKYYFNKALHENPAHAGAYHSLGTLLLYEGRYEAARENFKKAYQLGGKAPNTGYNIAVTSLFLDDRKELLKTLRNLKAENPDFAMPYYLDGLLSIHHVLTSDLARDTDLIRAINQFTEALHRNNQLTAAWLNRGYAGLLYHPYGLSKKNTLQGARSDLQKALQLDPENIRAFDLLAGTYTYLSKPDSALICKYSALKLKMKDPGRRALSPPATYELFYVLQMYFDTIHPIRPQEKEAATPYLARTACRGYKADPDGILGLNTGANPSRFMRHLRLLHYLYTGDDEGIRTALKNIPPREQDSMWLQMIRADQCLETGETETGMAILSALTKSHRNYIYSYLALARAYSDTGQHDKALDVYDQVIEKYPRFEKPYINKASLYFLLENYDSTLAMINIYLRYQRKDAWAWYIGGCAQARLGRPDTASKMLEKCLKTDADFDMAYEELAQCYHTLSEPKQVKRTYRKMIVHYPVSPVGFYWRGRYELQKLNDPHKAIVDFNKALSHDEHFAPAYEGIGDAYLFHRHDYHVALENYEKAIAIDTTDAALFAKAGRCHYLLGNDTKCIIYSRKASVIDSTACDAIFNEALATLRSGRTREAAVIYQTAFDRASHTKDFNTDDAVRDLRNLAAKQQMGAEVRTILQEVFDINP